MTRAAEFIFEDKDEVVKLWLAIMQMQHHALWLVLDESIDYEDIGKRAFIRKLRNHFTIHKELGDTELYLELNYCNGCNQDKPVCTFIGNHSKRKFSLYFDFQQNKVVDIYHCHWFGDGSVNKFN